MCGLCAEVVAPMISRSAGLASEVAETLRCARSGGPGPSAEAAVTRDRRDRERRAVWLRSGRSSIFTGGTV